MSSRRRHRSRRGERDSSSKRTQPYHNGFKFLILSSCVCLFKLHDHVSVSFSGMDTTILDVPTFLQTTTVVATSNTSSSSSSSSELHASLPYRSDTEGVDLDSDLSAAAVAASSSIEEAISVLPQEEWLLVDKKPVTMAMATATATVTNMTNRIPKIVFKMLLTTSGNLPSYTELYANAKEHRDYDLPATMTTHAMETNTTTTTTNSQSLLEAHQSWSRHNPDYEIRYYDLKAGRQYLQQYFHPLFLRTFDCLQAFGFKSDFLRMAFLYREGGYYSDWKEVCLQPNLLNRLSTVAAEFTNGIVLFEDQWSPGNFKITNGFVGAIPYHPVIVAMIQIIIENVARQYYGIGKYTVHELTGPGAFGQAYLRSVSLSSSPSSSSPLLYPSTTKTAKATTTTKTKNNPTAADKEAALQLYPFLGKYNSTDAYYSDFKPMSRLNARALSQSRIVQHKCMECSWSRSSYPNGNNYSNMYSAKRIYCEDAPSLIYTTT